MRTANAIAWTGQMSVVHLCLKLLYVLYCYCEASLSLGKALYKLNIIIIIKEEGDLPACYQCSVQKPASLMIWGA